MEGQSEFDPLSRKVIGLAIEVHRELGPGLLESTYEHCLCHEFKLNGLTFRRQPSIPIRYKDLELDCGYRLDILVEDSLIVEIKAVEKLLPVHSAQLLTHLKLSGLKTGLLFNFNSASLRQSVRRFVR